MGSGQLPQAADSAIATLQHKLGSANESGTQNRATANGAKSRQRSIATRLLSGCVPRSVEKERRPPLRHQSIISGGNLRVFENLAQTLVAVDAW